MFSEGSRLNVLRACLLHSASHLRVVPHQRASALPLKMIKRKDDVPEVARLRELRTTGRFCDVNIKVESESIPCHKIVLFLTVGYIRKKLEDGNHDGDPELEITGVTAEDFKVVLRFVYGEPVSSSEDNILRLLQLAECLDVEILRDACMEYMTKNASLFSSENLAKIFIIAQKKSITTVVDALIGHFAKNFVRVIQSRQSCHISQSNLMKIFYHPKLQRDITQILNFLGEWIKFHQADLSKLSDMLTVLKVDGETRVWVLDTLKKVSCLPYDDPSSLDVEIRKEIYPPPFLVFTQDKNSADIGTINSDIREYRLLGSANELRERSPSLLKMTTEFKSKSFFIGNAQLTLTQRRPPNGTHQMNMYAKTREPSDELILFNSCEGSPWPREPRLKNLDNVFTAAFNKMSGCIYIYNNFEFFVYACESNTWHELQGYGGTIAPSMSSVDSCLYLAGGVSYTTLFGATQAGMPSETNGKSFTRYDVRQGNWQPLRPMKHARCGAASCVHLDQKIYVSGGNYLTYFDNAPVEYFDTRNEQWYELDTYMPKAKMGHCCVSHCDHLWFFGGQSPWSEESDLTWFAYNIKDRNWSEILTLPSRYVDFTIKQILDVHPEVSY